LDGLTIVIMIGLGGVAALVAFVLARDSDAMTVTLFAMLVGTAVALFVAVAGAMAIDRSLALGLATIVDLSRQTLPAAGIGALIGAIWARRFRREV
jgi:hypothetical protein